MKICQKNGNLVKTGQKHLATDMEKSLIPDSTRKCPVGAMLTYADRQKLQRCFCKYANEPKQTVKVFKCLNYSLPQQFRYVNKCYSGSDGDIMF